MSSSEPDADGDEARTPRPLQAAAIMYPIAFSTRAGHEVLTLRAAMPRAAAPRQPLCADIGGFSLHAAASVGAHEPKGLEQPCRYVSRPTLPQDLVQCNRAGRVALKPKIPWRDRTTHRLTSPLECMQRLAALVRWPRLHPIRLHGVPAPNARLRARSRRSR